MSAEEKEDLGVCVCVYVGGWVGENKKEREFDE
jgi:hypothetical protein